MDSQIIMDNLIYIIGAPVVGLIIDAICGYYKNSEYKGIIKRIVDAVITRIRKKM